MKIYINRFHKSFKNIKISHQSLIAVKNNRRNNSKTVSGSPCKGEYKFMNILCKKLFDSLKKYLSRSVRNCYFVCD